MDENNRDVVQDTGQQLKGTAGMGARKIGRKAGSAAVKAVKAVGRRAKKTAGASIKKILLIKAIPILAILFGLIIVVCFVSSLFDWSIEERGAAGGYNQDPVY